MKASEYRERTLEELHQTALDLKQDMFNLRFQHATGQLDDVSRLSQTKRDLARVKTIIREHEKGIRKLLSGQPENASDAG
jgi:large subunit ribosomal protein L29